MNSLHINSLPPAQQPRMSPLKCGGGAVSLVTIHPSAEPMTKVQRMFNGINHLQIRDKYIYIENISLEDFEDHEQKIGGR